MANPKWEKFKKHDTLEYLSVDEIFIALLGSLIFTAFQTYKIVFIILVILWYWLKMRHYERKIIEKEKEIYNIYYENIHPVAIELIVRRTEKDREPMRYDLKQLENKRRFLVDKFVLLNLILIVLIELFIT